MSADKPPAESGVEYSGLDIAGIAYLAGYLSVVIRGRTGTVDIAYFIWYVVDWLGSGLRLAKGPAKGE